MNNLEMLILDIKKANNCIPCTIPYHPYLKAPENICNFLDYFSIQHNRDFLIQALTTLYCWIKALDHEIDNESVSGEIAIEALVTPSLLSKSSSSTLKKLTPALSLLIRPRQELVIADFKKALKADQNKRCAQEMKEYIEARKNVGRCIANTTFSFLQPYVCLSDSFVDFYRNLGETGDLIDAIIDFHHDRKNGEYAFTPNGKDYLKLFKTTSQKVVHLFISYPFLIRSIPKHVAPFLKTLIKARNS